jgi:hypothetical protein
MIIGSFLRRKSLPLVCVSRRHPSRTASTLSLSSPLQKTATDGFDSRIVHMPVPSYDVFLLPKTNYQELEYQNR